MDYVLKTTNLIKYYKDFKALDNLTMHVPKGSIHGFVGRNGAGKTTLIRLVCGMQSPTSGDYELYDISNTDKAIAGSRRRMGAVVETPSIYLDMTAEDNLKQQYRILGLPSFDGLQELLKLVGLENTRKKKAKKSPSLILQKSCPQYQWNSSLTDSIQLKPPEIPQVLDFPLPVPLWNAWVERLWQNILTTGLL